MPLINLLRRLVPKSLVRDISYEHLDRLLSRCNDGYEKQNMLRAAWMSSCHQIGDIWDLAHKHDVLGWTRETWGNTTWKSIRQKEKTPEAYDRVFELKMNRQQPTDDWLRADGDMLCIICKHAYYDHPRHPQADWLRVLCDGRQVKL